MVACGVEGILMHRWILALTVIAFPAIASAQCSFDAPFTAKSFKSDLVRAYVPCGSGITFPAPNTAGAMLMIFSPAGWPT